MSDPRYPGVTDSEGAHSADSGYDSRSADSSRAHYSSDPYGQPASTSGGSADAGGGSRGSGGSAGYSAADQGYSSSRSRSESGGRSSYGGDYGDAAGRGYSSGSAGGGASGYPSQGGYSQPTTYDTSGRRGGGYDSAKTTYDTTGGKTTYDTTGAKSTYDTSGAKSTYDTTGGRSTYDTRGNSAVGPGAGGPGAGGYSSPAARMASAMRRSVASAARGPRGPRRARLQLKHIDPWSTLKLSLVLAVALFVVWMVAVGLLYGVLDGMGVFDKINGLYEDVTGKGGEKLVGPGLVLGVAALIGAINIVLFTALATVGSFVYNMCADMVGGVEVTLSEHD